IVHRFMLCVGCEDNERKRCPFRCITASKALQKYENGIHAVVIVINVRVYDQFPKRMRLKA
ncbi:hypothetical protein, partial [Acinetobacter baumannii]|uniref:hypothetical protein n=1 Tax=Acinetobacter baumannii TaxID=470 RepID=UPI001C0786EC